MADWSNLSKDLLELVAQRLIHITDHVSFGVVCVTWRLVSVKNRVSLWHQIPVLMMPQNHIAKEKTRKFYSLIERRVSNFQLPVPRNYYCRGSTDGWLVTVDESCSLQLLNPFSRNKNEIQLPSIHALSFYPESKVVLSSNPGSSLNFVVLFIFRTYRVRAYYGSRMGGLAFYRSGDKEWTVIDQEGLFKTVDDAIFYKQKFYVVDGIGNVITCDVGHPRPSLTKVASPPPWTDQELWVKRYLVESMGDLLQVKKILYPFCELTSSSRFRVFKLDFIEDKWVEVKSLGDRMLFLGINTSFSLSASDFPGCKPNCIYFTDDLDFPTDFGVFNLENRSSEPLYQVDITMESPTWIVPTI